MATDERWKQDGVRVIPGTELDPNTAQTPGMDRKAAITFARVGARKLWAGTVHIHPNAKTGAHHHGPLESVIYVVKGRARLRWDGATLVSKTIADNTQKSAGEVFTQTWTMRNSGTTTWTAGANGYKLNRVESAPVLPGSSNFFIQQANPVNAGNTATYSMQFTAPTAPGTYTERWRMTTATSSGSVPFGETVTITIVVPQATLVNGATLVSKTIADNTQKSAGEVFTQTWTMRNSGTTTWTPGTFGFTLNFGTGRQMASTSYITLSNAVAPGGQGSFSVTLTAPNTPGTYTGSWQMHSASTSTNIFGTPFGDVVTVRIVVPQSTQVTRQGVDYSSARPSPGELKAAGYSFVVRYVSPSPNSKNITSSEAQALQATGIDIILVFESSANRMLGGFAAGVADANTAVSVGTAAGAPQGFFCYFACDFDASANDQPAINAYLDGAPSVLGLSRVGFYGGYKPLKAVLDANKASKGWQTSSWSLGNRDPRISLFQDHNTPAAVAGCDFNFGFGNDLGQWSVSTPLTPVLTNDAPVWDANAPAGPAVNLHWTGVTASATSAISVRVTWTPNLVHVEIDENGDMRVWAQRE